MIQITFVMEQHIGHRAYYQNLRKFIDLAPNVAATWVPVTYSDLGLFWSNLPFLSQNLKGTLNGRWQVRNGIRRAQADVLLFNTQVPAAIAGKLVQKQPYLLCTDITPIQYNQMGAQYGHRADNKGLLSRYKHWVNVNLLRNAAYFLPWSTWTRDSLVNDYEVPLEKTEVIAPGVDLGTWRPFVHTKNGPLRILFVGGDFYRKGGDVLFDAFHSLPHGSAELHLVTRTQMEPETHIRVYNDLKPNSPELIGLYQTADVFVLPSRAEAFGIAAVEASAVGLPIVATDVGGLTDIVVSGKTGFLVKPGDATELSERLHQLATNPGLRQRLGEASRQRAEQRFDARRNAARMLEILQQIAIRKVRQ
ncbi:MAG: glycosyltransferase family 4 protein [Anaerolineae bacterium]|nr:glycosyltransferase family 4 protein [Anaerolineae bacterium]